MLRFPSGMVHGGWVASLADIHDMARRWTLGLWTRRGGLGHRHGHGGRRAWMNWLQALAKTPEMDKTPNSNDYQGQMR